LVPLNFSAVVAPLVEGQSPWREVMGKAPETGVWKKLNRL